MPRVTGVGRGALIAALRSCRPRAREAFIVLALHLADVTAECVSPAGRSVHVLDLACASKAAVPGAGRLT